MKRGASRSLGIAFACVFTSACASPALTPISSVRPTGRECRGVTVKPGDAAAVQNLLDRNSPGTTFCFSRGLYRFGAPIDPHANQRLIAARPGSYLMARR